MANAGPAASGDIHRPSGSAAMAIAGGPPSEGRVTMSIWSGLRDIIPPAAHAAREDQADDWALGIWSGARRGAFVAGLPCVPGAHRYRVRSGTRGAFA